MKSLHSKLLALAGTLAIFVTAASAQTSMKASVPFAFQAGSERVLPAGDYRINSRAHVWYFQNTDGHNSVIAVANHSTEGKTTGVARLVFECRGRSCALRSIESGTGEPGAAWPSPKTRAADANELARIVVIRATVSAD